MLRHGILCCMALAAAISLAGCKQPQTSAPETVSPQPAAESAAPASAAPAPAAPAPAAAALAPVAPEPIPARPSGPIVFTDVSAKAGIHFKHNTGAFGKKYLPETMGSGVCFLDYDNDGWQDILLINSKDWPGHEIRQVFPRALPQQSEWHLHRCDPAGRARGRDVRAGLRGRRLRQRR